MPRPRGSRNADFAQARDAVLRTILHAVSRAPHKASFAELADVSGVSRATLRHYFATLDDLLEALLAQMAVMGDEAAARFPDDQTTSLEQALRESLERLVFAWRVGVGALFTAGLLWGLGHDRLGPAYVRGMLEPLLRRTETQIIGRMGGDGVDEETARYAALALVSPVVVVLLHQESLGGSTCRPLDTPAFVKRHLDQFLRGWFADGAKKSPTL